MKDYSIMSDHAPKRRRRVHALSNDLTVIEVAILFALDAAFAIGFTLGFIKLISWAFAR